MNGKHFSKYFQKYHIFLSPAIAVAFLYSCNAAKKVPEGEFLLTKNNFKYEDGRIYSSDIPNYAGQKPNKKFLYAAPLSLWIYNLANPKYDSILTEYMTYPREMRNQNLRDSLFVKSGHPEYKGNSLFWDRVLHNLGKPPVILDQGKTQKSAENIRKFLVYRGYWDAKVRFKQNLDSSAKKAQVDYLITHKDPTFINGYYYNIPDKNIKAIFEEDLEKSTVKSGEILDQTKMEQEIKRISDKMKERGYYKFNASNQEIYFTADTLTSRKQVPVTMDIHKDSADTPYKLTTIGNVKVHILEKMADTLELEKDSLRGITFHKLDDQYRTRPLWRQIILAPKEVYNQRNLDLTKRNIIATNNFSILSYREKLRPQNDSILDVSYYLAPLPKYELKFGGDINYSQILNLAVAPSVDLTTRNIFGGAENLSTSVSGIFGSVRSPKNEDKRLLAYEISAQVALSFPRLLLPFNYWRLIPKKYSPTSSINLGASVQNNIGLGRINFNGSLNYYANVNDVTTHRLTLFNTQLSLTQNKERYYDFFVGEKKVVEDVHNLYFAAHPDVKAQADAKALSFDEVSAMIVHDPSFQSTLDASSVNTYNAFQQSLINKDRQTQDVLISSFIYNFIYNEIGKKQYRNPFYFNGKIEVAGNVLGLVSKKSNVEESLASGSARTIFKIPYSQFIKFDFDVRKYFTFFDDKHTLALRQFVGIGIPYGNSSNMPFVRSYFNGGSNDIRAWRAFSGLGPADSQLDEKVRSYIMDNVKLTTNIEYRVPFTKMFEGAAFVDAGNIWSLKDNGFGDQFKFGKFIKQMGVGGGLGLRINVAYITVRVDAAYKLYDPNQPDGQKWRFSKIQPLKPVLNLAFGYPF